MSRLVSAAGGAVRLLEPSPDNEGVVDWSPDSTRLLIERTSIDVKDRTLLLCAASTASCQPVYTHRDEKYLASNDQMAAFSPDGQSILFTSDQDGWNHPYVMPAAGGVPRQLTEGAFEVSFPSWSHDGQRIFFSSTEAGTDQRQIYSVAADGGRAASA